MWRRSRSAGHRYQAWPTATLSHLYLGWNNLAGAIPGELGLLANLERLNLRSNDLAGSIPGELGNLASLVELNLRNNDLGGLDSG